ncbi:TetR/AcrR family transcriptional regulator [Magnetospirillum molischianum]|uniref:Putative transcriptional regulator, TetR family protein n=1 Tax=Magnetospirillum molischianum DSM 120 TaxID=1150626 RepID=H8FNA1_MAGML|nr:TetR/AcrR family transcriptional regulator [Magnetospirillum molischianum]CCG39839.1 Putative transcriptional regulator, TetR family protein [Magnetospirillum molischianum DSM 120]
MTQAKPQGRGLARRQAMLDAARELFLEKGFECTSLTDILKRSKGSRSTLYEQFGSKAGLLRAMVEEVTSTVWQLLGDDSGPCTFCEAGLIELGRRFVYSALAPETIAVYRIIVAEGHRVPEIAEFFFNTGPRTLEHRLAERFRAALSVRENVGSPEEIAQIYLGAVLGDLHVRQVLGLVPHWSDEQIDSHVRIAVGIFLDGVGRPPSRVETISDRPDSPKEIIDLGSQLG